MSQFQKQIRNLATLDVLRVCYNRTYVAVCSYTSPCCGINIYNILAWASRCCSNLLGNATASVRGTTTVEFHVFFVPKCTTKPSLSLPDSKLQATCAEENCHLFYLCILNKSLIIIKLKY